MPSITGLELWLNIFSLISDPPLSKGHYHSRLRGSSEGSCPDQPTGKLTVSEVMNKLPYWVIGQTNQISIPADPLLNRHP